MTIETIPLPDGRSRLTAYLCDAPLAYNPGFLSPAVIICAGGGFGLLAPREMEPVALRFVCEGISAFVLEYPVGDEDVQVPTGFNAAALAVAYVRAHKVQYAIDPGKIAVCGFSAGGYVAAQLATGWHRQDWCAALGLAPADIRPSAAVLCYPVVDLERQKGARENVYKGEAIPLTDAMRYRLLGRKSAYTKEERDGIALQNHVGPATCPCFVWHTADDASVHVDNSLVFAAALARHAVPFELHVFRSGLHGLALANRVTEAREGDVNPACAQWFPLAVSWLDAQLQNQQS